MTTHDDMPLEAMDERRAVVSAVLEEGLSSRGCPCNWPQFEYWAGKTQGPGWQDNIQNCLVELAVRLRCFGLHPPRSPEYWLVEELHCGVCGTVWLHFCEEWRMLAFHERLVRADRRPPYTGTPGAGPIGADIAATAGFEPAGLVRLTLAEWADYMIGIEKSGEPGFCCGESR